MKTKAEILNSMLPSKYRKYVDYGKITKCMEEYASQDKWISVKERLPESENVVPYESYFVYVCNPAVLQGGVVDIIRWDAKCRCWAEQDKVKWFHSYPYQITHWQPINITKPTIL